MKEGRLLFCFVLFFNILCALECVYTNCNFQMHLLVNVHVYIPGTQYVKKGGLT